MSIPKPPADLTGHCSVIHDNKLYIYTPTAFLTLPLEEDAKWKKLSPGISVTGAACFNGGVDGNPNDPAFYVVGGKSDKSDYLGVQRYSFSEKKWTTIEPRSNDLQNRTHHAAIYLDASASILIFAGSQNDDTNPSTQTFLMSAAPPYDVQSLDSNVSPTVDPILLPWSVDKAVMVGGGPDNTGVFTFSAEELWRDAGTGLTEPLGAQPGIKCALVSGADGSKILQIFDMTVSPNQVRRYALALAGGTPAPPGQAVGGPSSDNPKYLKHKRELILADYPAYDDTFAPTSIRNGFSLAQDSNQLVVISGGNKEHPIAMFDQSKNSWQDLSDIFGDESLNFSASSSGTATSTTSHKSTSTSSSSELTSSTEAATITTTPLTTSSTTPGISSSGLSTSTSTASPEGGSSSNQTMTIIGATLGAVLGFAALLIIILLLLAWKRRRNNQNKGGQSRAIGDKDRLSFQDQGMEPLTRSVQPMGRGPVPSVDSWIMVSDQADGKLKPPPAAHTGRDLGSSEKGRSPLSKEVMIQGDDRSTNMLTPGLSTNDDKERGDRLTDEGWSKYFQGDNETMGGRTNSLRSSLSSDASKSDYRNSGWPHSSAEVPPLNLGRIEETGPLGKVSSGSPSTEHPPQWDSTLAAQQGMSAKILSGNTNSMGSDDFDINRETTRAPNRFPFQHDESHTPTGSYIFKEDRVPSSNYSNSIYQNAHDNSLAPNKFTERRVTQWPSEGAAPGNSDESNSRAIISSDVSWLNLGGKK